MGRRGMQRVKHLPSLCEAMEGESCLWLILGSEEKLLNSESKIFLHVLGRERKADPRLGHVWYLIFMPPTRLFTSSQSCPSASNCIGYSLLHPICSDRLDITKPHASPSTSSEHSEEFGLLAGCGAAFAIDLLGFSVWFAGNKGDVPGKAYDGDDGEHPAEKVCEEDGSRLYGCECVWGEDGT